MKRAIIFVIGMCLILTGCFMEDTSPVTEVTSGEHYLKGRVIALEGCYSDSISHTPVCVGVVEQDGMRRSGRIAGDVRLGFPVYKECNKGSTLECDQVWHTSVGEHYLQGGEIPVEE